MFRFITTISCIPLFLSLFVFCFYSASSSDVRRFHLHGHGPQGSGYTLKQYARPMLQGLRRNLAEQATNSSLTLLAAEATTRRDPLNNFELYKGGWNITDEHYWASVGFTAAPFFTLSVLWFVVFGVSLFCMCICCCCCRKDAKDYKNAVYKFALVFLALLFLAAIAGSVALYLGQGKLQSNTVSTFNYIIKKVETTVRNLVEVAQYLVDAKNIDVVSAVLPDDVRKNIDSMDKTLNATSGMFGNQTLKTSLGVERVLGQVGLSLNLVAAFMLTFAFLGLVFSILGWECVVYVLVILGWVLVTITFILCAVFLLFHYAIGDTCLAMNEWIQHPAAHTAMDQIVPCMDKADAEAVLSATNGVTYSLVYLVNGVISNISNSDIPSDVGPPFYFNQSGPPVPLLCNPFNPDLSTRNCASGEVNLTNAVTVWKEYTCEVSPDEICMTRGRLTPSVYRQNIAAINVSFGLYHYGPFLVSLGDCTFIRETLSDVTTNYCPGLMKYTKLIYIGSVLLAASAMFSVILWMVLTRQSKRRSAFRYNQF